MYYIALLEAYRQAEIEDCWASAEYTKALQVLIKREYKLNYER